MSNCADCDELAALYKTPHGPLCASCVTVRYQVVPADAFVPNYVQ